MSKRAALVAALVVMGAPSPVFSDATADLSAEKMMEPCQDVVAGSMTPGLLLCAARINAVRVTIIILKEHDPRLNLPYCIPPAVSNKQAARIFVKFGNDHPELLHISAEGFLILALGDAYPCSQ